MRYGLKHHLAHRFRLAMVLMALSLGVAIFVSSYESVLAAKNAIEASTQIGANHVEWEVSRGHSVGVEEALVGKIRAYPGAVAVPVAEYMASTPGAHPSTLLILGLEPDLEQTSKLFPLAGRGDGSAFVGLLTHRNGIVVAKPFADSHGLRPGTSLALQTGTGLQTFFVAGVVGDVEAAQGNVGFMSMADAQRMLGRPGEVDRIEVAGVPKGELERLCPSCEIDRPGKLSTGAQDALGRIDSLLGVSVLALLVGILLIYNSVQVSVLERLQDIAILRAIGATRIQIFFLLLSEWFLIGLAGSAVGIVLGSGLAALLVEYTKRTVNTMAPLMGQAHVEVNLPLVMLALAIGTGTALIAAFLPAWSAAHVRPLEILRPYSFRRAKRYLPVAVVGLVLFGVANYGLTHLHAQIGQGLALVALAFFSIALVFPQVVIVLGGVVRSRLVGRKDSGPFLAMDNLLKAPHRTAFTIMTFGCSLMMTVATEALVDGFRESTGMWMNSAFPFDISVMGNDLASSVYGSQVLPISTADKISRVAGVRSVYPVRKLFTAYQGQDAMAVGVDLDQYTRARKDRSMGYWPPELGEKEAALEFREGRGVFVSNNFAELYGAQKGSVLHLKTPTGPLDLNVLGCVDDYSWPHGVFIINLPILQARWKDQSASYVDFSVARGYALSDVKQRVLAAISDGPKAYAFDKEEIRAVTDSVLNQAVSMANLQAAIAVIIGVLGVMNAVWIGVMNRKRELALWRAIGVTRRQVGRIVLLESLFVGVVSAGVGVIGGVYGGWVPLRSFSFDITGYLYPLVVPWIQVGLVTVASLVLSLVAGAIPAYQACELPVLDSIGYE